LAKLWEGEYGRCREKRRWLAVERRQGDDTGVVIYVRVSIEGADGNLEQFSCAGETGEMLRMKEPNDEGVANHIVSESCAARPQGRR
jgi:hypothetical protein